MAFKKLPIETWGGCGTPDTSVRVKRQSDRKFFDASDATFKDEADVKNPWVKLTPTDSPLNPTGGEAYLDMDPRQWTDGDYTVYFHDNKSGRLFYVEEFSVFDGDSATRRTPFATEIVARFMDSRLAAHTAPGTVGGFMNEVLKRLK